MKPKFRIYLPEYRETLEVSNIFWTKEGIDYINVPTEVEGRHEFYPNEELIYLMQYTGLKDKNGVEIFEGDIVKRTYLFNGGYGETHTGEVVYDEKYARYVISRPQKYIEPKTEDLRNVLSDKSTYKVIGNIWENPELLEVAE